MKKNSIFIIVAIFLCGLLCLTACGSALPAPAGLRIEDDSLVWEAVDGANSYKIDIDGEVYDSLRTSYSLTQLAFGEHKIKVMALSDGKSRNSAWSNAYTYEKPYVSGVAHRLINNNTEYEISSIGTASGDLVLNSTYLGKPVTSIGGAALGNNTVLTSVVIPDGFTNIGERAFSNSVNLTKITIPDSVTNINAGAFQGCANLKEIIIPAGITSIPDNMLNNCASLTEIIIHENITSIGNYAFSGCIGITKITIPDNVVSIGSGAFHNMGLTSVTVPDSITSVSSGLFRFNLNLKSVTLPTGITDIGYTAFTDCIQLTDINIPEGTVNIAAYAFLNCISLEKITIPDSVVSIGAFAFLDTKIWNDATDSQIIYADKWAVGHKAEDPGENTDLSFKDDTAGISDQSFTGSSGVRAIEIPASVKHIGSYAFAFSVFPRVFDPTVADVGITSLTFKAGSRLVSIGNSAFAECRRLGSDTTVSIDLPDTVTSIGENAFYDTAVWNLALNVVYIDNWLVGNKTDTFTGHEINDNTVGIADYAFKGLSELATLVLHKDLKYIGKYAFAGCSSLSVIRIAGEDTTTEIPDSVISIGTGAFFGCIGLTEIVLPKDVTTVADYLFYGCSKLEYVTFKGKITSIGRSAFYKNIVLKNITFPNSVIKIGDYAFYGCTGLTILTIPNSLKNIGRCAFYNCFGLTNITFGSGLEIIGESAFYRCIGLINIKIPDSVISIGNHAFYEAFGLTNIVLGSGVKYIGDFAFANLIGLVNITLPDSLESIGNYAFAYCEKLVITRIPHRVKNIGDYAFRACYSLTSITLSGNTARIGAHAFNGNDNITFYTDATARPSSWDRRWNSSNRPVVWGASLSADKSYIESFVKSESNILNPNAINGFSEPCRDGYIFDGWAVTPDGVAEYTAETLNTAPEGTLLYAVWK